MSLPFSILNRMYGLLRWHTRRPNREQTILEHSAQVALLAMHLAPEVQGEELALMLKFALEHDAHEVVFGDIPRPALAAYQARTGRDLDRDNQEVFWGDQAQGIPGDAVSAFAKTVVRLSDILEAAIFSSQWVPGAAAKVREEAFEEALRVGTIVGMGAVANRARLILDELGAPAPAGRF